MCLSIIVAHSATMLSVLLCGIRNRLYICYLGALVLPGVVLLLVGILDLRFQVLVGVNSLSVLLYFLVSYVLDFHAQHATSKRTGSAISF